MTPVEFKAVQRGYQLHLADQRDQIIFGKQIPQGTVRVEPNQDLQQLFEVLIKRNEKIRNDAVGEKQESTKRLMTKRNLIESLFGQ